MYTKFVSSDNGPFRCNMAPHIPLEQIQLTDYTVLGTDIRIQVSFRNLPLRLLLSMEPFDTPAGHTLTATVGNNLAYVNLDIIVMPQEDCFQVTTGIIKHDTRRRLPTGIGLQLWMLVPGYVQSLADETEMLHVHTISQHLGISRTPMSREKWENIFITPLETLGYERTGDTTWEKVYYPRRFSDKCNLGYRLTHPFYLSSFSSR